MAQRKQSFRFRIPWLSGAPESLSRRSKDTSKPPTQSDTNVPIQRPSRPSAITPAESPPSPTPTKTQLQNQSPPPHPTQQPTSPSPSVIVETTQSKPPSPSASPNLVKSPPPSLQPSSHASQVHVVSTQPQSPSHLASDDTMKESTHPAPSASEEEKEKMVNKSEPMPQEAEPELKVNSPLRAITKSPETSFQPERMSTTLPAGSAQQQPSSSSPVSKTEPASQHHPPSPLDPERTNEVLKAKPEETTSHAPSSTSQEEKEEMASSPVSKTEPASQPHPPSPLAPERTHEVLKAKPEETTSQAPSSTSQEEKEEMAVAVSEQVPQEAEPKMKSPLKIIPKSTETSSQPENLSTQPAATLDEERSISTTPKAPFEKQSKFLQHEEKEKVVHETKKVGKAKDTVTSTTSQPTRRTKASASGTKAKDPFDKKQHGVRETVERKIMFATSNSSGKDVIGVVSSTDPGTRNVSSISPQRTVSSSEEKEKEKEKAPLQKGIKDDISKFVHKISASVHPTTQPTEDKQFSVITLAGENRGATMHVGSESAKKEGSIHIHRAYKTDPEESTEVTTDGEGNTNTEEEDSQGSMEDGEVGMAYVNSNIQSINNSLMFHGSITERDPGVQVTLPQKPSEPFKPHDKDTHGHRTEFNISRAQKPTYQPTVRRRCLRGLFLEPSDSDPGNPDKPRSHGCKFSCGKNNEDIEIM